MYGGNNIALAKESKINISQLKKQAERGDAKAQNKLGDYFNSIINFSKNKDVCSSSNHKLTIKYYTKAAQKGYVKAQKNLGMFYSEIPCPEYDKGVFWLKKVALKGDIDAQLRLADLYSTGNTDEEFQKAVFWYKKAAQSNDTTAMFNLGQLYSDIKYGHIDYEKAIFWFKKATYLGNSYASLALSDLYFIAENTPETEIERYKKEGMPKDIKKSDQYSRIAAAQGNPEAQFYIGVQYMMGRRVPKDEKKAMEYFKKSCLQNYESGCKAYNGKMNFNDLIY